MRSSCNATRPALCAVLLTIAALTVSAASTAQTFRTGSDLVVVDVSVMMGSTPVVALGAADFEILDNGVPQRVTLLDGQAAPIGVVLMLDVSASVRGALLAQLKSAANRLLDGLRRDDAAALLVFADTVAGAGALTTDIASIRTALEHLEARGATSLIDGAAAGLLLARSTPGRRVLLCLFSDGVDTSSWLSAEATSELAKGTAAVFYGVTNTHAGSDGFLVRLSGDTGGDVLHLRPEDDLAGAFAAVLDAFRHRYLLGFVPNSVGPDGWHTLKVRVKRNNVTVRARSHYFRSPLPAGRLGPNAKQ